MTHARLALPLLALLGLSACIVPIPLGTYPVGEGDSCGARGLQSYVGQPAGVVEGTTIRRSDGSPAPVRVIRPGDAVTQDFVPERVNFDVGADGRVTAVRCG